MNTAVADSVADILAHNAGRHGDRPAVVDDLGALSHSQLADRVAATAAGLRDIGVVKGTKLGILGTNRSEWIVATYAAITLGATVAAFATWSRKWDMDHLLKHSRCEVLITVDGFGSTDLMPIVGDLIPEAWEAEPGAWRSKTYPDLHRLVVIGDRVPQGGHPFTELALAGRDWFAELSNADQKVAREVDADALVLYTSGSTSRPKAVRLGQRVAIQHAREVAERMDIRHDDRILVPVPLFWSYGGANALMVSLVSGCPIYIQEIFDAGDVIGQIEQQRCTVIYTLPSITRSLLAHAQFSASRVETLQRGMTIGPQADVRAAAEGLGVTQICNAYGSTEMYGGATVTPHYWSLAKKCSTQGPPLPGNRISIIDSKTAAGVATGDVGEICVSGYVSPGYLDQPEASSLAFVQDGAFLTGDYGRIDADGCLHFAGRASEMVRSGGINISPIEIEDFLCTHEAVLEAAIVGTEDPDKEQVAIGFVRVVDGADIGESTLIDYCRSRIASYKIPRRIILRHAELPKTPTGKLLKKDLLDDARNIWATSKSSKESKQ